MKDETRQETTAGVRAILPAFIRHPFRGRLHAAAVEQEEGGGSGPGGEPVGRGAGWKPLLRSGTMMRWRCVGTGLALAGLLLAASAARPAPVPAASSEGTGLAEVPATAPLV